MAQEIAVPKSMSAWCAGLYEYGKVGNTDTGQVGELMVHITVTKANAIAKLGFHISAYTLGGGGKVLNDYNPNNAASKLYFYPGALASGACLEYIAREQWGPNYEIIKNMPVFATIKAQGIAFFIAKYPAYKKPAAVPKLTALDFPALGS